MGKKTTRGQVAGWRARWVGWSGGGRCATGGEVIGGWKLPNGLNVSRRRVPLGVLGAIFESRPNVTIDIASLCLKSGYACVIRGGSEAIRSNTVLARVAREAETAAGVPEGALQLIENTDRALIGQLLEMREYIDIV